MNDYLVDSSFIIALYNPRDKNRKRAQEFIAETSSILRLPEVALAEISHMLRRFVSQRAVLAFMDGLQGLTLQSVNSDDLRRAKMIMQTYHESDFDLVDCCIMALAERLQISEILTFDRRDFGIYRPNHTNHLHLLP
ncbi:MAG: PIN domain-containing protein [Aggregatilineales bacterium]